MAYRRGLFLRAKNYAQQRFSPSFPYLHHDNEDRRKHYFLQVSEIHNLSRRGFVGSRSNNLLGFGEICEDRRGSQKLFPPTLNAASFLARHMSTTTENVADMLNEMKDVLDVQAMETSQAPAAVSEVAVAAADSFFPVAALQYLIDGVHSFTGLNWWASIAVTTLLVQGMIITPIMIHHYKVMDDLVVKVLRSLPLVLKVQKEIKDKGLIRTVTEDKYGLEISKMVEEFGLLRLTPYYALLSRICVFLTFFFAIGNMVENVPSLKSGGAFWIFTDLTTPDSFYILPLLSALTYWISLQRNISVYKRRVTSKYVLYGAKNMIDKAEMAHTLLIIPLSMYFSKAYFCCWITSNIYMFVFRRAMKSARVRQLLGMRACKSNWDLTR